MTERGPDWDAIAGEIEENSPAQHFGDLNRFRDEGRLGRYLIFYEFRDEDGGLHIRATWSHDEAVWAIGAATHAAKIVQDTWLDEGA